MKTVKIILLLGLLAFSGLTFAQNTPEKKNSWRTEAGVAYTGTGDTPGYCLYTGYSRMLSNRFSISPSVGFIHFYNNQKINYENDYMADANAKSLEFTGYYFPVKRNGNTLEVGLGVYYRYWKWIYATGPYATFITDDITLLPSSYGTDVYGSFGYTISVGGTFNLGRSIGLNLRLVWQNDTRGDNVISTRVGVNFTF